MGAMRRQSECTPDQRYPASGQTAGGHAIVGEFVYVARADELPENRNDTMGQLRR